MKGYKAFDAGWKCRDFQYEIGKTYELGEGEELAICKCGFHFCEHLVDVYGYYSDPDLIAEVEALGNIQQAGTKFVTDKIRIVREITLEELRPIFEDPNMNTGILNSGTHNSGTYNTGNYNSGHYNTGHLNSGSFNVGNSNAGYGNVGSDNLGDHNCGSSNSGDYNVGNGNSGSYNSGGYNTGHSNSGGYNSGNYNTGYFNSGNNNSGLFNTNEPHMRMFNQDAGITFSEFSSTIDYYIFALLDHISVKRLTPNDIAIIKALPNFDYDIFKTCTGIDLKEMEEEI